MGRSKVRLGVIFDQHPQNGGGFSQAIAQATALASIDQEIGEAVFYTFTNEQVASLLEYGIRAKRVRHSSVSKISSTIRKSLSRVEIGVALLRRMPAGNLERILKRDGVDLAYYLSPSQWNGDFREMGFISTFWDNAHREHVEFPEVYKDYEFECRELAYSGQLKKAVAVMAESEHSKLTLIEEYGVAKDRVYVSELIPGIALKRQKDIPHAKRPFVLYPAQFWPHKNHVYLVDTIKVLSERGVRIDVVFAGSDKGNLRFVEAYAEKMGVRENVIFEGFVTDERLSELYEGCLCVAMPSYFGPSNVPPLEAQYYGKKVYLPDLAGIKSQLEYGFELFDIDDPSSLAKKIEELLKRGSEGRNQKAFDLRKERLEKYMLNIARIASRYGIKKGTWSD